ncbi:protein of unknown function [Xenorhabdus nematophila AN6/1]|nr:protein of unknown function [Xenorhabdus nematophila AN6/1]
MTMFTPAVFMACNKQGYIYCLNFQICCLNNNIYKKSVIAKLSKQFTYRKNFTP